MNLYARFVVGVVFLSGGLVSFGQGGLVISAAKGDIDGDGHGDVILRHEETGYVAALGMSGSDAVWADYLGGGFDADPLRLAATLDLDGDGTEDLVWRYSDSDLYVYSVMDGTNVIDADYLLDEDTFAGWEVMAAADFNRDGYGDLLVSHREAGVWAIAYLEDFQLIGADFIEGVANVRGWRVCGAGDVDGDGYSDVVVQNERTGHAYILWMENHVLIDTTMIHGAESESLYPWRIAGLSDVDASGQVAFLLQLGDTGYYELSRPVPVDDRWLFASEPLGGFTAGLGQWRVVGPR